MRVHPISVSRMFSIILFFGLLAMTARSATDPDLWWHLRTGKWIVETGHVPHADPFSFTRAGHPWLSHEWLTDSAFFELWKHSGYSGLIIFSAIITTAGFMLLYFRCPGQRHWAAAVTALGALASSASWGVRPQMFTFTLASLLLWLLERGEERPRFLWWIPPVFLLWLNLHAGFALGAALLLAYAVGLILEGATGATPAEQVRPLLLRLTVLLVICFALVPINPSGAELYRYPFDTLRSHGMRSFIGEWFSPDFHDWLYRPFLLVWLLLITALACARVRVKARTLVPLLLTGFAALDAVRHIPIFILIAMPVIAAALPQAPATELLPPHPKSSQMRPLYYASIMVLMLALVYVKWSTLARVQAAQEANQFPQQAIAYLKAHNDPPNLFVYYDWGGYAIWKLYPEYRVFIDGRADLYGDDLMHQFKVATQVHNGWKDVLNHWHVEIVLLPPSSALAQALLLDPSWHAVFRDSRSILLLREPLEQRMADLAKKPFPDGYESEKMFPRGVLNLRN